MLGTIEAFVKVSLPSFRNSCDVDFTPPCSSTSPCSSKKMHISRCMVSQTVCYTRPDRAAMEKCDRSFNGVSDLQDPDWEHVRPFLKHVVGHRDPHCSAHVRPNKHVACCAEEDRNGVVRHGNSILTMTTDDDWLCVILCLSVRPCVRACVRMCVSTAHEIARPRVRGMRRDMLIIPPP